MFRFFSAAAIVAAALLPLSSPASAGSDIIVAAVASGRLYVIGTTERPRTAVMLDDRFRTESDHNGRFQYELVYYPASCIVAATIEGTSHEAVVSNCGQQVIPGTWLEPHPAVDTLSLMQRVMNAEPEAAYASFCPAKSSDQPQKPVLVQPLPVFTAAAWADLFVQSEPLPTAPTGVAVGAAPASPEPLPPPALTPGTPSPLPPAAAQMQPTGQPAFSVLRQVRSLKVQPILYRSSATASHRGAAD